MFEDMDPTSRKLMSALMQFRKLEWNRQSIAGRKASEIRLLLIIKHGTMRGSQSMKVSEISRRLDVTPPTVTQLVKGLEANGLVERHTDPKDRRAVGIALTRKGTKIVQRAFAQHSAVLRELTEYLGEEESDQLAELLLKMFHFFEQRSGRAIHTSLEENEEA